MTQFEANCVLLACLAEAIAIILLANKVRKQELEIKMMSKAMMSVIDNVSKMSTLYKELANLTKDAFEHAKSQLDSKITK